MPSSSDTPNLQVEPPADQPLLPLSDENFSSEEKKVEPFDPTKYYFVCIDLDETFINGRTQPYWDIDINGSNQMGNAKAWIGFIREMEAYCKNAGFTLVVQIISAKPRAHPDDTVDIVGSHLREFLTILTKTGERSLAPKGQNLLIQHLYTETIHNNFQYHGNKGILEQVHDVDTLKPIHLVHGNHPNGKLPSKAGVMKKISAFFTPSVPYDQMLLIDNDEGTLLQVSNEGFSTISAEGMNEITETSLKSQRTQVCLDFLDDARDHIKGFIDAKQKLHPPHPLSLIKTSQSPFSQKKELPMHALAIPSADSTLPLQKEKFMPHSVDAQSLDLDAEPSDKVLLAADLNNQESAEEKKEEDGFDPEKVCVVCIDIDQTLLNSTTEPYSVVDFNGSDQMYDAGAWIKFIEEKQAACKKSGLKLLIQIISAKQDANPDDTVVIVADYLRPYLPLIAKDGTLEGIPKNQFRLTQHLFQKNQDFMGIFKDQWGIKPVLSPNQLSPIHLVYGNSPFSTEENPQISKPQAMKDISHFFSPPIPYQNMLLIDNDPYTLGEAKQEGFKIVSAHAMDAITGPLDKTKRTQVCKKFLVKAGSIIDNFIGNYEKKHSISSIGSEALHIHMPSKSSELSESKDLLTEETAPAAQSSVSSSLESQSPKGATDVKYAFSDQKAIMYPKIKRPSDSEIAENPYDFTMG